MALPALQPRLNLVVGLTDEPEARFRERGSPEDWRLYGPFHSEAAARRWEQRMANLPGCFGVGPDGGWRYGFTCSARPGPARRAWAG